MRIFVDGVEQRDVVWFDLVAGYVVRYARDDNGDLIKRNGALMIGAVSGIITINFDDEDPSL